MNNKKLRLPSVGVSIIVIGGLCFGLSLFAAISNKKRKAANLSQAITILVQHLDQKYNIDKKPIIDTNYYKVDYEALRSVRDKN